MPNLNSLSRLVLKVLPSCMYTLHGPAQEFVNLNTASKFDDAGVFIGDKSNKISVKGLLTSLKNRDVNLAPEGMRVSGSMMFTTESNLGIAGNCSSKQLSRWRIEDKDGTMYTLMSRSRKGCIYSYTCELDCSPEC